MFDAHLHIFDPRFPLVENEGYLPDPYTIADYRKRMSRFDIDGGAVVSGSFQGTEQSYLQAPGGRPPPAAGGRRSPPPLHPPPPQHPTET
ncbi:hypothetical protein ACFXO7_27605, partial [Nocardia tengchongensis]